MTNPNRFPNGFALHPCKMGLYNSACAIFANVLYYSSA